MPSLVMQVGFARGHRARRSSRNRRRGSSRSARRPCGCRGRTARARARAISSASMLASTLAIVLSPMRGSVASALGGQRVESADVVDEAFVDERERQHVADALDIHRAARAEVAHAFAALRRARRVRAARHRFAFGMIDGGAAHRAVRRHREARPFAVALARAPARRPAGSRRRRAARRRRRLRGCPCAGCRLRCAASRCCTVTPPICTGSSTAYGLSVPVRPTLIPMSQQLRRRFARAKLERDRPARILADAAELLLQREIVDFDDDAVDLVVERRRAASSHCSVNAITSSIVAARRTCGFVAKPCSRKNASSSNCVLGGSASASTSPTA